MVAFSSVSRGGLSHRASSASSSRQSWGAGLSLPLMCMLLIPMVVCIVVSSTLLSFMMEVSPVLCEWADKWKEEGSPESAVPVLKPPEEERPPKERRLGDEGEGESEKKERDKGRKKKKEKGRKKEKKEKPDDALEKQEKEKDAAQDAEVERSESEKTEDEEEPQPPPLGKEGGEEAQPPVVDCRERENVGYSLELERQVMAVVPPPGFPWLVQRDTLHRWREEQQQQQQNPKITKMTSSTFISSKYLLQKLEQVLPDDEYKRPIPMPYFLSSSRQLVARKAHLDAAHNLPWSDRVQAFEQMMEMVLEILQQVGEGHSRFQRLWQGDLPLLFDWDDFLGCGGEDNSHPRFTHSRPIHMNADQCAAIPIPSYDAWLNHFVHQKMLSREDVDREIIRYSEENFPWESKIPKALWRGTTTGQREYREGWTWRDLERSRLVLQGLQHPDIFDVGFYMIVQMHNEEEEEQIRNETRLVDLLPFGEFRQWRAIIDVEGNSWSSRFARLMCTNSVVIKITPRNVDYFHDELVPWVHYVPAELDNIVDIVRFVVAEENQQAMKLIVAAANDWCRSKMSANAMATDMLWILLLYAEMLDKGDVQWKETWRQSSKGYYQNYDDVMTVTDYWIQRKKEEEAKAAEG